MKLNVSSIRRRLQKLGQYIAELERQQSVTLQTFKSDFTRQLAVERAFQAAIESCSDIAAHIVSVYQLGHPQESRDVFRFLVEAGYLDAPFGEAMMALVGFRKMKPDSGRVPRAVSFHLPRRAVPGSCATSILDYNTFVIPEL